MHLIAYIQQLICERYQLTEHALTGRIRPERAVWPRMMAIALAFEFSGFSKSKIGREFNRNECSIHYAINAVKDRTACYPNCAAEFSALRGMVWSQVADYEI